MVAALVRTIFAQTDTAATRTQLREVVGHLEGRFDKDAELLADAEHDVTAYAAFHRAHWRKIWSTNPRERVNKQIKQSNVLGVFPNDDAANCLVGAVLAEVHDDWQVADRRDLSEGSMAKLNTDDTEEIDTIETPELPAA